MGQAHFAQALQQEVAHARGILHQTLPLHDVEHGKSRRTGQMVAAESGAQLPVDRLELRRDEHAAHGETVADAFGHGDDVGPHAEMLVGEEAAGTAVAALYLVADEHRARLVARLAQALHEFRRGQADAAHALDALDDDGAHIALGQFPAEGLQVVEGQVSDMPVGVDGRDNLGIVRGLHRQRRAPMEGFLKGEHPGAPVVEAGQFQGVLVGLGAGVDEKQTVVLVSAGLAQTFGQLGLQGVDHGVAVKAQPAGLPGNGLHIPRMAMTDADDGVPAVQVEILPTLVVPHATALSAHDVDIEQGINII